MEYTNYIFRDILYQEHDRHVLGITQNEASRLLLNVHERQQCWKRSGGTWERVSHTLVFRREIDEWLRDNFGYRCGEVWSCDRPYFPDEPLPELPTAGRRSAWLERFVCYGDITDPHNDWGWMLETASDQIRFAANLTFHRERDAIQFKLTWG